ncbi:MAG: hypothetical protein QM757_04485 [Paludibaculum sp.]
MITGANDYAPTADSDIVIITAGFPRKPGMSRDDLLLANYEIVKSATEQVAKYSPNAIMILVTNPLDAMCWVAQQVRSFPGTASSAWRACWIRRATAPSSPMELGVSVENVTALVLGGHGDTMVPIVRLTSVWRHSDDRTAAAGHGSTRWCSAPATAAPRS